jgi:hypothetical protein
METLEKVAAMDFTPGGGLDYHALAAPLWGLQEGDRDV